MDVKLPRLGEGADSGVVVNIMVSEGEQIQKDQTILELENEKAVAPIPSPLSGTIQKIHVKEGDEITVGQVLISLAEEAAAPQPAAKAKAEEFPQRAEKAGAPVREAPEEAGLAQEYRYEPKSGFPPPAPPSIRKLATDLGIDLTRVQGSEPGGRITLNDVRAYIQRLQQIAFAKKPAVTREAPAREPESIDFAKWGPVSKKRMSPLRRTVAERTSEAWATVPHVFQLDEGDITAAMELRKKYAPLYEKKGARLTLTGLVLKAAIAPLKKFPIFNASLDETTQEIVYKEYFHIGVAVDTESGLIVPVIRDVDKKNLLEISKELAELAERTRQRKISLEELQGGTLTISNLGGIGGAHFTPIVYKPQSAVIGLGQGELKAVVRDGKVEARLMLPVTLSYDHRLIDGADGARFVRELVQALESFKEADFNLEGK
ncbi:MAG: 2-oxo acid dehydrogenase subunit E2 [Deltaproteobacteria bacterium]|nr:2-oxo acid dehydrogenase subunit E2 [Deltaproteobacteria bacterium]